MGVYFPKVDVNIVNSSKQISFLNIDWIFFALTLELIGVDIGVDGRIPINSVYKFNNYFFSFIVILPET